MKLARPSSKLKPVPPSAEVLVIPNSKGKGVTGKGKFDGNTSRFTYGKICTAHPMTDEPLVIVLHRSNQNNIAEFKFKEDHIVEFDWILFKGKYTAKNLVYTKNDTRYKLIRNLIINDVAERETMIIDKFIAYVYAKYESRKIVSKDRSKVIAPKDQAKFMTSQTLRSMGLRVIGRSGDLITFVKV
tara:strand:- start:1607 stop:2164 length:558 start_codon:yes stop_codon:yes gene_type:complete